MRWKNTMKSSRGSRGANSPSGTPKGRGMVRGSTKNATSSGKASGASSVLPPGQPQSRQPLGRFINFFMGSRFDWLIAIYTVTVFGAVFAAVWGRTTPAIVVKSQIVPMRVHPGEMLAVHRYVRWQRMDCHTATLNAILVDSLRVLHIIERRKFPVQDQFTELDQTWTVPFTMPLGPGIYRSTVSFNCFPFYNLWPVSMSPPDIPFVVVAKD